MDAAVRSALRLSLAKPNARATKPGRRADAEGEFRAVVLDRKMHMPDTSRRVASFTESVIRHMTRLANTHGAINLSQGFPDFDPPEVLKQAAEHAGRHGPHQYAVTWGAPNFRQALARKQSRFTGLAIDPDAHIVVTCGSTEAMMVAMMTACNPGDRVIVFSPFYENYVADTILSGAQPIYVPLHPPDFRFDEAELRAAFAQRPKAMILCNPANPSGHDHWHFPQHLILLDVADQAMYPRQVVQNNHEIRRALPCLGQKFLAKTEADRVTVAAKDVCNFGGPCWPAR